MNLSIGERVTCPVLLLLSSDSPLWASHITTYLDQTMPDASVAVLEGLSHEGIDNAPELVAEKVSDFLRR